MSKTRVITIAIGLLVLIATGTYFVVMHDPSPSLLFRLGRYEDAAKVLARIDPKEENRELHSVRMAVGREIRLIGCNRDNAAMVTELETLAASKKYEQTLAAGQRCFDVENIALILTYAKNQIAKREELSSRNGFATIELGASMDKFLAVYPAARCQRMPNPRIGMCTVPVGYGYGNSPESSYVFVDDVLTNMNGVYRASNSPRSDCSTAQAKFRVCKEYSGDRFVDCLASINAPPGCMSN